MAAQNEKLANHLTQVLIVQEAKQFVDSITRVKAFTAVAASNQQNSFSRMPFLFRKKRFKDVYD